MKSTFRRALAHVLAYEGGYADHPMDPGGATKFGITRATLARFRGHAVSKAEVKALGREETARIYRILYWDACDCSSLPAGLDLAVFDCAVNQGVSRAKAILKEACGAGRSPARLPELVRAGDPVEVLGEFSARRMWRYGLLQRLFRTFGLGWSRRLIATHGEALRLVLQKQQGDVS